MTIANNKVRKYFTCSPMRRKDRQAIYSSFVYAGKIDNSCMGCALVRSWGKGEVEI